MQTRQKLHPPAIPTRVDYVPTNGFLRDTQATRLPQRPSQKKPLCVTTLRSGSSMRTRSR